LSHEHRDDLGDLHALLCRISIPVATYITSCTHARWRRAGTCFTVLGDEPPRSSSSRARWQTNVA